jgi:hypothetical protein
MKTIIFLSLLIFTISCSNESEDPEPMREAVAPVTESTIGTGCAVVQNINAHSLGVTLIVKAELKGYFENVSMTIEKRGADRSFVRKPSAKDITTLGASFGSKGDTLHLGLFPCASSTDGGRAYRLTITQGNSVTIVDWKVGNTYTYIVK